MRAIVYKKYGSTNVLQSLDIEKPMPKGNEILIKIHATTVTPVDTTFRAGSMLMARLFTGLGKPKNTILGTELSGVVEGVGHEVSRFKVGDKVFASPADGYGAHAEYICLSEDSAVEIMPTNMSFDEAASICNGALTALPFLRDNGEIKPRQKVLINGAAGSIGTFAVQLAKHFGAEVTAVCSGVNVEFVTSLGADKVIDYTKQDFTKTGETYDIIFDTVGKSTFSQSKSALRENGIYMTTVISAGILLRMMFGKKKLGKRALFAATGLREAPDQIRDMNFLKRLIEDGQLRTVIDRSYTFENIAEAHAYVEKGHKKGNVVVTVVPAKPLALAAE